MAVRPRSSRSSTATAVPTDIVLMNAVAGAVYALAALVLFAAAVAWVTRAPMFTLRSITLDGELVRGNLATVRANALPHLAGNFFSIDLDRGRAAFETVPWVRRAVVRRVWPDRLAVTLEEHRVAALWVDDTGGERLVNSHGEVFEANLGDVEDDKLVTLEGPDGTAAAMLAMQRRLAAVLAGLEARIDALHLSSRGSWRAELDNGAELELGRGSEQEVVTRTERFVRTFAQATARFSAAGGVPRALLAADLRHADGYALRLRGITTTSVAAANAAAASR